MNNHDVELLKEKYGVDFINDFLLYQEDGYYFYLDLSKSDMFTAPFIKISGDVKNIGYDIEEGKLSFSTFVELINRESELCQVRGIDAFKEDIKKQIEELKGLGSINIPLVYHDRTLWIEVKIRLFEGKDFAFGCIKNVTNEKDIIEKLYLTSYKDSLTGLFNRNTCMVHLRTIQKGSNAHVLMIDLDSFKLVNDKYGHTTGDEVLRKFALGLLTLVDDDRIFYRLSGDEFLIQVKNYTKEQVIDLAKEVNRIANETSFGDISLSASVGITKYDDRMIDLDILRCADYAMYEVKNSTKNHYAYFTYDDLKHRL